LALLLALVLDDGRRWGDVATDWQRADAAAVLDLSGPRMHAITRPRGGSKTTDVAGIACAALVLQAPPASRSYAVAVDQDQAGLLHAAMAGFVRRTPGLGDVLEVRASQVVNRRNAAALEVLASDADSAWGLLPWLLVVDELAQWRMTRNHADLWAAIVSSHPKSGPSGRLVAITSAGDPGHWSHRVISHARSSSQWRVSETPGPLAWWSVEALAEQRALLTESQYARLIENRWLAPESRLTTVDAIHQCVRRPAGILPAERGVAYVVSLDIGVTDDRTVVAVGHAERTDEGATMVVLDRLDAWQGSRRAPVDLVAVGEHIVAMSQSYNRAKLIYDPYNAIHLTQLMRRHGVRCVPFGFNESSVGRLGLLLYRLLRDSLLDLPDDADLIDELANVELAETRRGNPRLTHERGRHDDRAVAIALLAHELLESRVSRRRSIVATTIAGDQPAAGVPFHNDPSRAGVARWRPL
jgi:hypothetical protein